MQSLENGKTVEEVEDRQAWLSRLEEQQRESHDKRAEILQNEFQRKIEEKEAQLDCMRSNAEQLLTQVRDSSAERDLLKKQLKGLNKIHLLYALFPLTNLVEQKLKANSTE